MSLEAGGGSAGNVYLLLGSSTGTFPGFVFDGVHIPLVFDSYTSAPQHNDLRAIVRSELESVVDETGADALLKGGSVPIEMHRARLTKVAPEWEYTPEWKFAER